VIERVRKYVLDHALLTAGDRVAIAVSGGADSVALLRVLLELRKELGIVISVAHFHHGIRGGEADADQHFVAELSHQFDLAFHCGSGNAPAQACEHGLSLETAARDLRHQWFSKLLAEDKADKIATAHTLDDQAETVLMRVLRGAGAQGLSGIAPQHKEKRLIRPLLKVRRTQLEQYLRKLQQPWREDSSNQDLAHTRNRVRHQLMPLLEQQFNPGIRQTLGDLSEVAQAEAEYWASEVAAILPKVMHTGKPSRSGRSNSGSASATLALDLARMKALPLAMQRQVLHKVASHIGITLEFKHIQQLTDSIQKPKAGRRIVLPGAATATLSYRELQFSRDSSRETASDYSFCLQVPGEVAVTALGSTIRARVITGGDLALSGYNPALLLDRALLQSELIVRNWRAGDRFFPAHSRSPKKVKELLQPARLGRPLAPAERLNWPVIESAGRIVWVRGFSVPEAFSYRAGDAVLIEEVQIISGVE